jgi:methylated-DNA-[protein]-cysteine S-methyltransferase
MELKVEPVPPVVNTGGTGYLVSLLNWSPDRCANIGCVSPPHSQAVHYRVMDSPVGPLTLAGVGATLMHVRMAGQSHEPDRSRWEPADGDRFSDAAEQLDAYFAGTLTEFALNLNLVGTGFQRRVWAALRTIPYGQTRSYGQIAEQIGSLGAARAVGLASGRNPISIIVPCHRVIGSSGGLTGYAGGLDRKKALLSLEKSNRPAEPALFALK